MMRDKALPAFLASMKARVVEKGQLFLNLQREAAPIIGGCYLNVADIKASVSFIDLTPAAKKSIITTHKRPRVTLSHHPANWPDCTLA